MESFDLYREAKNQYEKLIPERNDGLILLSLYGKYRDRDFMGISLAISLS